MDPGLSWAFLGVGLFGQAVALVLAKRPIRLFHSGGRARGTFLETEGQMEAGTFGGGHLTFFPSIEFRTARGENIIFASRVGGNRKPDAGTQIDVLYDPKCPREAEVLTFRALWLFPMLTSLFSLPFLFAGLFGVFQRL